MKPARGRRKARRAELHGWEADKGASGGIFHPVIFGWMVHVYPFERDPAKTWTQ